MKSGPEGEVETFRFSSALYRLLSTSIPDKDQKVKCRTTQFFLSSFFDKMKGAQ